MEVLNGPKKVYSQNLRMPLPAKAESMTKCLTI